MFDLLLPPGIKGLTACSVSFLVLITLIKKASCKRFLNQELKPGFLLNPYITISHLFFDFAVHKLWKTA